MVVYFSPLNLVLEVHKDALSGRALCTTATTVQCKCHQIFLLCIQQSQDRSIRPTVGFGY